MTFLPALAIAAPLLAAAVGMLSRNLVLQRVLGLGGTAAVLGMAIALTAYTAEGRILAVQVGGWPAGFAIPLVTDLFAALMLAVSAILIVTCTAFAMLRQEDRSPFFHSLVLILTAGVSAAFLTGDLFNLFVAFEVMLIASYVLLTVAGGQPQIRAGAVYVTTSLMGSTLLVAGVALLYAVAGTVNMAVLAGTAAEAPGTVIPGALLLVAFAVKGSLVPVHGWLPRSYPAAGPGVAALFSGLLTKVGIYALYRVYAVVFGGDPRFRGLLLAIASVTMAVGVAQAMGSERMRQILSFHIVSQVGYMVLGLGLFGGIGLAGGIFYILHHMVVKTSLCLTAGTVETTDGTGTLGHTGGVARRQPLLAVAFVISALSLAGIPPLSGFFAKVALLRAAFAGGDHIPAAVAIVVSFFTLLSMVKIWNGIFWGSREEDLPPLRGTRPAVLALPAAALALISVVLGLGAEGLFALSTRAAEGLLDPSGYVTAVMGS